MAPAKSTRRKPRQAPVAAPPAPPAFRVWWGLALVVVVTAIAYWNSLGNPFVFDDQSTLVTNPYLRSLSTFWHSDKGSALTGRPVVAFTFALNYALGGMDVVGYRLVNIGLHAICGLLLFGVVRRTLELPVLRERFGGIARGMALAIAVVWTLHPLNTEVVDYLTQRTESMMALFYLATMYASVRGLAGVRAGAWQLVAIAACAIGMLCKEPMATAPLMVVLFDRVFAFESIAVAFRRRWRFYLGLAASWAVVVVSVTTASRELSGGYATTYVSAWSYLLNQTVVITHYLELVVWPHALVAYYGWSLPVTLASVLPYAVFIAAALMASVVALVRWPRVGFLAMWCFITLAPSSSILPVAAEVGADRRMYVPLVGLVALAVVLGWLLIERVLGGSLLSKRAAARRAAAIGAVAVVMAGVALGARTVTRNRDYATELRLSETTLEAWPSGTAHDMVGLSLARLGRHEDAVRELRQAVVDYPPAGYDLGAQLFTLGQVDEAVAVLQRFVAAEPGMFTTSAAHTIIGRAFSSQHRVADAIDQFSQALSGQMPDPQAHVLLADLLMDQQRFAEAIDQYRTYLSAKPADAQATGNLGIALASANRRDEAVAAFRRAAELDPANAGAHENLARMLIETGQAAAAAAAAQEAVALAPGSPSAHDLLGQALVLQQHIAEARQEFEQAIRLDPTFVDAREHLRRIAPRLHPSV